MERCSHNFILCMRRVSCNKPGGPDPCISTSKEDHNLGVDNTIDLHVLQTRASTIGASLMLKRGKGDMQKKNISVWSSMGSELNVTRRRTWYNIINGVTQENADIHVHFYP